MRGYPVSDRVNHVQNDDAECDSEDKGKVAYKALLSGGSAGFDAVLGGGRSEDGQYARLEAHGFYWTASEIDSATGWFYNFGSGGKALHRQHGGIRRVPSRFAA